MQIAISITLITTITTTTIITTSSNSAPNIFRNYQQEQYYSQLNFQKKEEKKFIFKILTFSPLQLQFCKAVKKVVRKEKKTAWKFWKQETKILVGKNDVCVYVCMCQCLCVFVCLCPYLYLCVQLCMRMGQRE